MISSVQRIVKTEQSRSENMAIIRQHADPDILAFMRAKHTANGLTVLIHQPGMKRRSTKPITIGRKTYIPLTQGLMACVDTEYVHLVADKNWCADKISSTWYAKRGVCQEDGMQTKEYMHRLLYEHLIGPIPSDLTIDHINGNGLDNRIDNLRLADRRLQIANSEPRRLGQTSSNYPGVNWHKKCRKWRAEIRFNGIYYHLGFYDIEKHAYQARLRAIAAYHDFGILPPHKPRNSKVKAVTHG